MIYDPAAYWQERGLTYEAKFREGRYAEQEHELTRLLDGLEFESVLEVGCGFGRIGELVHRLRPAAPYTGIDLSPDMLALASERVPTGEFHQSALADYRPGHKFDLVLAVEVLMHVPPDELDRTVRKLLRLTGRHLVTVDWTTPLPRMKTAAHNFLHDYAVLSDVTVPAIGWPAPRVVERIPVGLQTIHHLERP